MDDWFYSFLTALWVVFNSNFWAALAGAFAGAVAASKFASRQQKRDDLIRMVNETNAAISISYSACEAYLTHKAGLIDDLTNAYDRALEAYKELQSSGSDQCPSISLNMIEPNLGLVQCSALQDLVYRIPSTTAAIRLAAILNHRNATLNGHMVERNELIRAMRLMDGADRTALFFGLARKDGFTDKTYPHLVNSRAARRQRRGTMRAGQFSWLLSLIIVRKKASLPCALAAARSQIWIEFKTPDGRGEQQASSVHLATCQTLPTLSPLTSPGFLSLA
jgi:hypothetical protein